MDGLAHAYSGDCTDGWVRERVGGWTTCGARADERWPRLLLEPAGGAAVGAVGTLQGAAARAVRTVAPSSFECALSLPWPALCSQLSALSPLLSSLCHLPSALFSLLSVLRSLISALRSLLYALLCLFG